MSNQNVFKFQLKNYTNLAIRLLEHLSLSFAATLRNKVKESRNAIMIAINLNTFFMVPPFQRIFACIIYEPCPFTCSLIRTKKAFRYLQHFLCYFWFKLNLSDVAVINIEEMLLWSACLSYIMRIQSQYMIHNISAKLIFLNPWFINICKSDIFKYMIYKYL